MVGSEEASCQSILVRQIDSSQTRPPIIARRSILSHKTYRNGSLETEAEVIWVASRVASSGSVNRALDWQYGGIEWNLGLGYLVRHHFVVSYTSVSALLNILLSTNFHNGCRISHNTSVLPPVRAVASTDLISEPHPDCRNLG
ncbi:hypothetical protein RRG08_007706 [Elysia crispata]|uniref:Uncharacterized protein n=1 Tax=Elysia crispata TaxID=231223 RepID=A0AAE1D4W8_9GAST|nr:hypothetical protein RRG08_007706 [Elysia crispata]